MHLFLSFLLRCSNLFTKYAIIYTLNQIVIQSLSKHFKSAFPSFSSIFHHIKSDRAVNNFNYVLRQQDYRRLANLRTAKQKLHVPKCVTCLEAKYCRLGILNNLV